MKVIDLLNKIANGEEVPKEIRLGDKIDIFYYQDYVKSYKTYDNEYLMCDYLCNTDRLNEEVEIIEEDKKIRKIYTFPGLDDVDYAYEDGNRPNNVKINNKMEEFLIDKINEIIDYINKEDK